MDLMIFMSLTNRRMSELVIEKIASLMNMLKRSGEGDLEELQKLQICINIYIS